MSFLAAVLGKCPFFYELCIVFVVMAPLPCSISYPVCLAQDWNPDLVLSRWKISVDLFSRMFLADGPGAERDSFLAARAGVAGRLAR